MCDAIVELGQASVHSPDASFVLFMLQLAIDVEAYVVHVIDEYWVLAPSSKPKPCCGCWRPWGSGRWPGPVYWPCTGNPVEHVDLAIFRHCSTWNTFCSVLMDDPWTDDERKRA